MTSADEIRERLERCRRVASAHAKILALHREGKLVQAVAVADALAEPPPASRVVHVDFARVRT